MGAGAKKAHGEGLRFRKNVHYVNYVKQARMDRIDRKDFLVSMDFKGEPIDIIQDRLRAQLAERIGLSAAKAREQLYYRMLAAGQFPSQGWRIAERTTFDGTEFKYECWPLPPVHRGGAL